MLPALMEPRLRRSSPRASALYIDPGQPPVNDRDQALTEDVRDVVTTHEPLRRYPLAITVRGGVAHISGTVSSENERALLRRAVARVRGINAVWEIVQLAGGVRPRAIDIGCGAAKQHPDAIGTDRYPHAGVDIVADLEHGLPFASASVDHVFAVHFLEHVHDLLRLMNDIHRILRPGGVLHVMVPNCQFVNAYADPTHVRFFNQQTFKFFCRPYPGLKPFRPLAIATCTDNIFADLQPVQPAEALASRQELARFFD